MMDKYAAWNNFMDMFSKAMPQSDLLKLQNDYVKTLTLPKKLNDSFVVSLLDRMSRWGRNRLANQNIKDNKKLYWDATSSKKPYSVYEDQLAATLPRLNTKLLNLVNNKHLKNNDK